VSKGENDQWRVAALITKIQGSMSEITRIVAQW